MALSVKYLSRRGLLTDIIRELKQTTMVTGTKRFSEQDNG